MKGYFEREWLDNALMAGMTPDEFWFGDPELYYNYSRVYEQKMKIRQQDIWSIGARMCQALGSTLIYPAGVVDKSAIKKMPEYPEMPYIDEKVKTEEDQELARQRFIVQMENWVSSFQRNK